MGVRSKLTIVGPVYPYRGGIARFTTSLSKAFKDNGLQVQVISFKSQYPVWLYPGKTDKDNSADPEKVEAEYVLDPFNPWSWWKANRQIKQFGPDLVIFQWWTTFWAIAFSVLASLLRKARIPVAYLIHNTLPHESRLLDPLLTRLALTKGHFFIVQTPREKEVLSKLISNAAIHMCTHPVYKPFNNQSISKREARGKLNLGIDNEILLFFGLIRPYKGLKFLLEALPLIRDKHRNTMLIIAGEFWEDKSIYLKQIERLNLGSCVRLEDRYIPDEEAHLLFSAADVLIAPYTAGTQSGVAAQALAYNLPLVVTEQVAEGISNLNGNRIKIIPAGDVQALSVAIAYFLDHLISPVCKQTTSNNWFALVRTIVNL